MKLWLSKNSGVPIQEQLCAQVVLGIVSADLAPGERLPSTSQLARRFRIHANTVRNAYQELAGHGWVEWRPGRGFYVLERAVEEKLDPAFDLDRLIATFFKIARGRGYTLADIQARISRWFSVQSPDHVLVIEPETQLREILIIEIEDKLKVRVQGTNIEGCSNPEKQIGAMCVALYDHADQVRAALPLETSCLFVHSRSIPETLAGEKRPARDQLITVVSRCTDFLRMARATLVAVGLDPAALDFRDARENGWKRGLNSQSFIITDSALSRQLPDGCRPRIFEVIADESMEQLRGKFPP